jgi:hypothetical protein
LETILEIYWHHPENVQTAGRFRLLGRPKGIIASTDGDTFVEPTWLAGILQEIDAGADAVGGRIVADPSERLLLHPSAERTYLRQVAYGFLLAELEHLIDPDPFDPFPRHPNHNGASLALTATTYARIGGLPDVLEEEDRALYKAIIRSGARFRHSLGVRATTSARLDGRVEHGFSAGLKLFSKLDQCSPPQRIVPLAGQSRPQIIPVIGGDRERRCDTSLFSHGTGDWHIPSGQPGSSRSRAHHLRR